MAVRRVLVVVDLAVTLTLTPALADASATDHGYLGSATSYPTGTTPYTLVRADLDGDGDPDLANTNVNGSSITTMRNDGTGTFTLGTVAVTHPTDLAVADLNADGLPDMVATDSEPNCCALTDKLATLLGTGGGNFGAPTYLTGIGFNVGPLAVGDVNGNGVPDAITTNTWFSSSDSQVHQEFQVHLGNGTGGWTDLPVVDDPDVATDTTTLSDIALVDINGDGDRDLAMADLNAGRVTVWSNNGAATFTRTDVVPLNRQTGDIVASDVDHDGDADLVVSGSNSGGLIVLLNNGAGDFSSAPWSPIDTGSLGPNYMAGADVNADGNVDLVAAGINQSFFNVYLGDGTGHFVPGWGSPYAATNAKSVAAGDLNGDGYADEAIANNAGNSVAVRLTFIDNVAPTTSVVLDPATPESGWYAGPVNGAVLASDSDSGVSEVHCVRDPFAVPTSYADMAPCPSSFSITGEGTHHVYSAAADRAGNEGAVVHTPVRIDGTAPVLNLHTTDPPAGSGWFTEQPTVVASATDPASGVAGVHCAVDPPAPPSGYDDMAACAESYQLAEGEHDVYSAARDVAGNTSATDHLHVRVDTTGPDLMVEVQPPSVIRGNPAQVVQQATDALSGVASTDCGDAPTDQLGQFDVTCTATDVAGNTTQASAPYDVIPGDVTAQVVAEKAAGTRLALTATVWSDGTVDTSSVDVAVPDGLRVDDMPDTCMAADTVVSCELGMIDANSGASATLLLSPRNPGPHPIDVVASSPMDRMQDDNEAFTSLDVGLVCDNTPTADADTVVGTSDGDILCGLAGNDAFRGLGGDDLIFGGAGTDTVSYAGAPATRVDLGSQGLGLVGARPVSGTGHGVDAFTGIENATGGSQADVLLGNGASNALRGGSGQDVLKGLGGADLLIGGRGHDSLNGGAGTDTCRTSADHLVGCER